jgi:hypothetical protein
VNLLDSIRRRVLIAVFGLTVATLLSFWNPLYSFRLFMLMAVSFSISSLLFSYEWATINEEGN